MDVTTTAALNEENWPYLSAAAYDFKVIAPDGTRENDSIGNGWSCLDESEALPPQIGPGEHVVGKVVLDSANTSGSIVFSQAGAVGGWEWGF